MNNSVWVFGDSFSEDIKRVPHFPGNGRWEYINSFLNGVPYLCWGEIVANELNYEYKNFAAYNSHKYELFNSGNSNQVMINNISYFSKDFKNGDIVFVGFTDTARFIFPIKNIQHNILPNSIPEEITDNNQKFCEKILIHRIDNEKFYVNELLNNLRLLETLSKKVGFHLFYWSWDENFEKNILQDFFNNELWIFRNIFDDYKEYFSLIKEKKGIGNILWETKNKIEDYHMGKLGNEAHAELILPYLKQQLKNYE